MTMMGIRTPGQELVSVHTKKYADDTKEMADSGFFLRYFREGLRNYLGPNPLLAVEMEDCRHCFGELYPVIFTIVLSIGEEGKRRAYRLPFKARRVDGNSYTIESRGGGTGPGALSMLLVTPDENTRTYRKIIERFQGQFGENREHGLNIDDGTTMPMPDASGSPHDAGSSGVA